MRPINLLMFNINNVKYQTAHRPFVALWVECSIGLTRQHKIIRYN